MEFLNLKRAILGANALALGIDRMQYSTWNVLYIDHRHASLSFSSLSFRRCSRWLALSVCAAFDALSICSPPCDADLACGSHSQRSRYDKNNNNKRILLTNTCMQVEAMNERQRPIPSMHLMWNEMCKPQLRT